MLLVLLTHIGATLAMTGLIWFVQLVHYPLMAGVGRDDFTAYHALHGRRTGLIVIPLMSLELTTGVFLALRPGPVPVWLAWLGLGLLAVAWSSTALLQVPQHGVLARGFDAGTHRRLVRTNWVRTVAWTLRGVLVLFIASKVLN